MLSDLEIAQKATLEDIDVIAKKLSIPKEAQIHFGPHIAKINSQKLGSTKNTKSKLILVTAMSPTPAGEGKTTTTIGLSDALSQLKKKALVCIREPSLGPVFGMKGGATGGGYSQVLPMENINLHFTGDFHAITSANNLLSALIDNHIYHGNTLGIDPENIGFKRCLDMNDRSLRRTHITNQRYEYDTGFDISVASEVMAIFCLATSLDDLKARLGEIEVAKNIDPKLPPILAKNLEAEGAMTALLRDAFMPNLVQTLSGTPALIHGGPFANIAHGCNSFAATKMGMDLADYVITEAGFGADLGAEKFINIKCRQTGLSPDLIVIVATIKALKFHGGIELDQITKENIGALKKGFENLSRHIQNCNEHYGLNVVVAINQFNTDTAAEIELVQSMVKNLGFEAILCTHWGDGPKGAEALANKVISLTENEPTKQLKLLYPDNASIKEKLEVIAKKIYHASAVTFENKALLQIDSIPKDCLHFPVCIAKTPYSFSAESSARGAASDHNLLVREINLVRGAGFIVAICGDVMRMPGLPKIPASNSMTVTDGKIQGLS
jgi:formate--tetrahydrofolate ligase